MNELVVLIIGLSLIFLVVLAGNIFLIWHILKLSKGQRRLVKLEKDLELLVREGFGGYVEASKNTLQFIKDGFDEQVELSKQVVEANAKHSEAVIKIDTENSQKIFDTVYLLVQMQNTILQGLGYTPKNPEDSGLMDVRSGSNHGKPPAPKAEDGLTITSR